MSPDADRKPTNEGVSDATAGIMAVVVGPSGAGKDTLMNLAARYFAGRPDVHFVRRVITRDGDAGNEDHRSVSEADPKPSDGRSGAVPEKIRKACFSHN